MMGKTKEINSLQNPLVKQLVQLKAKSRERRNLGLFVLEGLRELALAIKGDYHIKTILYFEGIISKGTVLQLLKDANSQPELIEVSNAVYEKIAYRGSTEGVVALVRAKSHTLKDLSPLKANTLVLVAEAPEKPGNIGALLRTADAANLDAVLIANPKGDLYNPNIIRSSVGCIFTNNIAVASSTDIIDFLKQRKINIFCAALSASNEYTKTDFTHASAIVVGTESTGLSMEWLNASSQNIIIPMEGEIDSMNVSVSAAILIFEAKRQRAL